MQHHHHHSNTIVISQRQELYNHDYSQKTLIINQPITSLTINGSNNQIIINAHINNIIINCNYNYFTTPAHSQGSTSHYLNNVIFNGQKNNLQCHSPHSVCSIVNGMGNKINGRQVNSSYHQQRSNCNVYNNFDGSNFNININNNSCQNQASFGNNFSDQIGNLLNMVFTNINNQGNNNSNVHFSSMNYNNNNYEDSEDDGEYEEEEGEYEEYEDEEEVNVRKARENVILNFDEFQFKHANKYIKNIEEKCAICLEKFLKTDIVKRFACGDHIFHKKCLATWLKKSNLCPLCKFDLLDLVGKPEYQGEEEQ